MTPESPIARVLIVDDEPDIRETLSGSLASDGYELATAGTAREALVQMERGSFDVVVVDIILPEVSGLELLERIRENKPAVKVVLITGEPGYSAAAAAVRLGAFDYLAKPVTQSAIRRCVASAIRLKRVEDENRFYRERLEVLVEERTHQLAGFSARLRDSGHRYRALIERSADAMALLDREGRALWVSAAAEHILGHRPERLIGHLAVTVVHSQDRPRLAGALRQLLAAPESVISLEIRAHRRDGTPLWLEAVLSNLLGEPAVGAIVVNFRDISDRKRGESEKAQLTEQVLQSQKMEALGRLAGGVAHDFNNLLTAILGYAELIRDGLGPEHPLAQEADELTAAGKRATALTGQLLTFSRRQIIEPRLVDLNLTLQHSQNLLARLLGEDIELSLSLAPDLWRTQVDPTQIDQILMNLAANARAAMPGGGRLSIETANVLHERNWRDVDADVKAGEFVMLAATDTGSGMSHETGARIFEPFFTTKEQGTGLGLATVYGIAKQHGGGIGFSSEPGVGTTFRLYFPRGAGEAPDTPAAPTHEALARGTETVLLVEDEASVRSLVRTMLEMLGYAVVTAARGEEALALVRTAAEEIDLLVTDVVMPGMNGRELFEKLHAVQPTMKCLFVSGYTRDVVARHGVLEEGINLLLKPFSITELATRVRAVLDDSPI